MVFFNPKKRALPELNEFNQVVKPVSLWADAWKRLKRNKMALVGLVVVILYILVSLCAPILPLYSYDEQVIDHQNLPPSFQPAGKVLLQQKKDYLAKVMAADNRTEMTDAEKADMAQLETEIQTNPEHQRHYYLGTDELGRDLLARIVFGGRISILIGLVGTITAVLIGIIIGAIAGYAGGWLDNFLMRFVDVMYGLPYMLLVIIMMALFGKSIVNLFVAIALVSWLTIARVVRGQIISLKNSEFIEAARSMGASPSRIIFKHLIPNSLGVLIVYSTLLMPSFIMNESFLSFLGLGVSAPLSSWGSLVNDGVKTMEQYPWLLWVPAIAMTVFLFAINFLGDGLRDALDPQSKNRA